MLPSMNLSDQTRQTAESGMAGNVNTRTINRQTGVSPWIIAGIVAAVAVIYFRKKR